MLGVPQFGDVRVIDNQGIVGNAAPGTGITSGAANTYSSVVECISAANNTMDSWGISITAYETAASAVTSAACFDILVGGATDDVLISSLQMGWLYGGPARTYFFPLHISAGARVAAQHSNETAARAASVVVSLHGGGSPPFKTGSKVTTYGTKINNSTGQSITPSQSGAAASATQLTASTTDNHFYFLPGFDSYNDTTITQKSYNIGIGVGTSTEERIGTWTFSYDSGEKSSGPIPPMGVWRHVPAATRLTLLASNSGANDGTYSGLIYAVS